MADGTKRAVLRKQSPIRIYPEENYTAIHRMVRMLDASREMNLHVCVCLGAHELLRRAIGKRLQLLRRSLKSRAERASWQPRGKPHLSCKQTSPLGACLRVHSIRQHILIAQRNFDLSKSAYLIAELEATVRRPALGFLHALIAALQHRSPVLHEADNS